MKTMDKLKIGSTGVIKNVLGEGKVRRRLFDMGATPGAKFKIQKLAPLGDPIQIKLRNYELTLRKNEAELIEVEEVF